MYWWKICRLIKISSRSPNLGMPRRCFVWPASTFVGMACRRTVPGAASGSSEQPTLRSETLDVPPADVGRPVSRTRKQCLPEGR